MQNPSAWSAKHVLVATALHHDVIFPRSEDVCDAPQSVICVIAPDQSDDGGAEEESGWRVSRVQLSS